MTLAAGSRVPETGTLSRPGVPPCNLRAGAASPNSPSAPVSPGSASASASASECASARVRNSVPDPRNDLYPIRNMRAGTAWRAHVARPLHTCILLPRLGRCMYFGHEYEQACESPPPDALPNSAASGICDRPGDCPFCELAHEHAHAHYCSVSGISVRCHASGTEPRGLRSDLFTHPLLRHRPRLAPPPSLLIELSVALVVGSQP